MRSLEQIIADNGYDNTPMGDSHNLTGRAPTEGVEWDISLRENDGEYLFEDEGSYAPLASYSDLEYLSEIEGEAIENWGLDADSLVMLPTDSCE